jgi:hypothetical protein
LRPCRYPYPADCPVSCDGSSTGHESLHPFCRDSAVSECSSHWLQRGPHYRGGSFLVMLRPARWLGRLTSPRRTLFQSPTGPPVYSRACPSRGLPLPESAITTRPNHLLPRRDSHPLTYQRSKAAHRIMEGDELAARLQCKERKEGQRLQGRHLTALPLSLWQGSADANDRRFAA